jgi:HD-GYP domain-containing protein (c-di-GMP phosphodiesterase class II)
MCTIWDIFDAMTTQRTYKDAVESFPTLRIMQDEMSNQLDMDYFQAFVSLMGSQ